MDGLPEVIQRVINEIFRTLEIENDLLEELVLDENDVNLVDQLDRGLEELQAVLPAVLDHVLRDEIMQMEVIEDDLMLELIYGRNERVIDWRRDLPRMEYLRSLEDPTFQQHFRMDRTVFEALIVIMGNHLVQQGRLIRLRTPLDKCLLMALWILFNLDTFRATGVTFGVSRGVVHFHYLVTIEALRELAPRFIKWPSEFERAAIKQHFEHRTDYPGIVGALDGTLIKCYAPAIQRERYFDRHQSYSINVQAICDHNKVHRDLYVGEPGSVHDNRVLQKSPIYNLLLEGEELVKNDEHIIADGGYEMFDKVLTPYRDLGDLTPRQRYFNFVHSSNRMCVERSFGDLRGKMRRLLKLYIKRFPCLIDHIVSSFVIHNIIKLAGNDADGICIIPPHQPRDPLDFLEGEDEDEDAIMAEIDEDAVRDGDNNEEGARGNFEHPLLRAAKIAGALKRDQISRMLEE